jgi:hypothetical protein
MKGIFNYIDRQSPIHELTGAAKLVCLLLWSFAAMATYDTLIAAGTYLVNCNWRAVVGDKEIAAWRTTGSVDDLYDELHKVFRAFSPKLTIEIIKA